MVEWKCKICAEWNRIEVTKTCRKCNPTNNATSNGPTTLPAQPSARTSEEQVSEAPGAALDVAENELLGATAQSTYDRQSSRVDLISQEIDRSEALAKREEIIQNWNKSKKKFTDPDFPPETCSLYYDGKTPETGPIITFRRVDNIETMDENRDPWVVLKDPRATDIEQGTLGNCWFVSALAVVAERPELIDKILVTKDVHPAGFFQVRLFHDGRWCTLTIDDYLPCDQDLLTYSQARRKQLWVSLIEKAAAKLHGCYEALIAGHSIESLRLLTGAPCETLVISECSVDELWVLLLSCHESNFLLGASSGSGETSNNAEFEAKGLRKKHAYSILDVKEASEMRLIKLKNPWARFGWNGDWCANSDLWEMVDEREKKEMLRDCANESVFWMCLADFKHYFNAVDICRLRSDWGDWALIDLGCFLPVLRFFHNRSRETSSVKVCVIHVERTTEVELVLQQASVRQSSDLSLVDLGLIILRGDVSETRGNARCRLLQENRRSIRLFTNLHTVLDPGVYSVIRYSFSAWHSLGSPTYTTLSICSRYPLVHHECSMQEVFLRDALLAVLEKFGVKCEPVVPGINCCYLQKGWCGMLLMAENRTAEFLHVHCCCVESTNVVSSRGDLQTRDSVPPNSRQLIMILTQLEVYERYSISHRLQTYLAKMRWLDIPGRFESLEHYPALEGVLHEPQKL